MAEVTRSPRVGALALFFITTIGSQASTLHAQISEQEEERPENPERPAAGAEGVPAQADRATGFPTGFWIEFDDTKDWLRLTSGEWLRGDLNWMRNGDADSSYKRPFRFASLAT